MQFLFFAVIFLLLVCAFAFDQSTMFAVSSSYYVVIGRDGDSRCFYCLLSLLAILKWKIVWTMANSHCLYCSTQLVNVCDVNKKEKCFALYLSYLTYIVGFLSFLLDSSGTILVFLIQFLLLLYISISYFIWFIWSDNVFLLNANILCHSHTYTCTILHINFRQSVLSIVYSAKYDFELGNQDSLCIFSMSHFKVTEFIQKLLLFTIIYLFYQKFEQSNSSCKLNKNWIKVAKESEWRMSPLRKYSCIQIVQL